MKIGIWSPAELVRDGIKKFITCVGWQIAWEHPKETLPAMGETDVIIGAMSQATKFVTALSTAAIESASPPIVIILNEIVGQSTLRLLLDAGVRGIVPIDTSHDTLHTCVGAVFAGNCYVDSHLLRGTTPYHALAATFQTKQKNRHRVEDQSALTKRERLVLQLLAEGKSVKEIAARFDLSPKTVDVHKSNLMRKLHVHRRAELTVRAIKMGFLTVDLETTNEGAHVAMGISERIV